MKSRNAAGLGTVTLVMLFSVMCLCIFALLSLSTARSELNLSERYADSVSNYYAADTTAVQIQNRLITAPSSDAELRRLTDEGIEIAVADGIVSYGIAIDDELTLIVELAQEDFSALTWQVVATGDWEANTNIEVWDGVS